MATRIQTRPSCARVKVEVDIMKEFPERIKIGMINQSGEVMEKWIKIRYDYVPKYCKTCMIQGHNEEECYVIHLELYPKEKTGHKEGQTQEHRRQNFEAGGSEAVDNKPVAQKDRKEEGFVEQKYKKWGG